MERITFSDGTLLIFLRHGNSRWNKLRNEAYECESFPPARKAGSRDSSLSAQGRVEAYFTGDLLKKVVGNRVSKKGIDFLGFSMAARTKQTSHILLESSGLRVGCAFPTDLLDERRHYSIHKTAMQTRDALLSQRDSDSLRTRHDTLLHYISLQSMIEGGERLPCSSSVSDAVALDPVAWFERYIKETSAELMLNFLECFIGKYNSLEKSDPSLSPDQLKIRAIAFALSSNLAIYAPSVASWACSEMQLPINLRRKTPTGENMPDVSKRAKRYLEFMNSLVSDSRIDKPVFVSVTHSLLLLAIRQLIEGFDDVHLNSILDSDGPPFPPNVGMVVYRCHMGRLARIGTLESPYHLAPELQPMSRRLYVKAQTNIKRVHDAADAVNAKPYLEPVQIGQDMVQVYGFAERRATLEASDNRPGIVSTHYPKSLAKSAS